MQYKDPITLQRTCDAVLIPEGIPITIEQGTIVYITQALGGSYTVNINGNLARLDGSAADALGLDLDEEDALENETHEIIDNGCVAEDMVWEQLRTCYDPEIPINIVELGLIYNCEIKSLDIGNRVEITMTLTAPGCGMGEFLAEDVRNKLRQIPNVTEAAVELTFDPPWNQTMMSDAARLQTGLY
ncbi:PaaD-like protein (DUF59) involved in Fe-S cluster assembly [uncultured Candidatus Thioglobus sp.]|nr:PaaD-like protein (DUF59) involved in Fe-S cluster assembly [uncultured Candidatus Thioglobus sp.]